MDEKIRSESHKFRKKLEQFLQEGDFDPEIVMNVMISFIFFTHHRNGWSYDVFKGYMNDVVDKAKYLWDELDGTK